MVPDHPEDTEPDDPTWGDALGVLVFILALIASIAFVCAMFIYLAAWLAGAGWEAAT